MGQIEGEITIQDKYAKHEMKMNFCKRHKLKTGVIFSGKKVFILRLNGRMRRTSMCVEHEPGGMKGTFVPRKHLFNSTESHGGKHMINVSNKQFHEGEF